MDMYGCWNVVAGKFFDLKPEQRVPAGLIAQDLVSLSGHVEIFISIDWGYKPSYHSAHWYAVFPDHRVVVFKELYGQELVFEDFVKTIAEESKDYEISATCLPHDMFRQGDRYRSEQGRIIGETKSDVFEYYGLSPVGVESGKGKVQLRYDKIQSACTLRNPDGVYKFRISTACPMLIEELDLAVHAEDDPTQIDKRCRDHAIDDFGLFLVYYSDDIEPLGFESLTVENKSYLQILLEEDERKLEEEEEDNYYITTDNYYDSF